MKVRALEVGARQVGAGEVAALEIFAGEVAACTLLGVAGKEILALIGLRRRDRSRRCGAGGAVRF